MAGAQRVRLHPPTPAPTPTPTPTVAPTARPTAGPAPREISVQAVGIDPKCGVGMVKQRGIFGGLVRDAACDGEALKRKLGGATSQPILRSTGPRRLK
jgi:hypothetical protein